MKNTKASGKSCLEARRGPTKGEHPTRLVWGMYLAFGLVLSGEGGGW